MLSGCAPRPSPGFESAEADNNPGASTGVAVFGDARLGVVLD
jgi:hypothetical protein